MCVDTLVLDGGYIKNRSISKKKKKTVVFEAFFGVVNQTKNYISDYKPPFTSIFIVFFYPGTIQTRTELFPSWTQVGGGGQEEPGINLPSNGDRGGC